MECKNTDFINVENRIMFIRVWSGMGKREVVRFG
jgi:hypothetical protein